MLIKNTINKIVKKMFPNLYKLDKLANAIDDIIVDENGSLYISYKRHVITDVQGGIINTSKGIHVLNSHSTLHINPIGFDITPEKTLDRLVNYKEQSLLQQNNIVLDRMNKKRIARQHKH